ncbi:MAG: ATP-binding cassette domain-containing protein [Alphaproteobacteria bacterium]|nr:ATP-binding cassette domain-containing protein [Alphaproteobacteria bacterium]
MNNIIEINNLSKKFKIKKPKKGLFNLFSAEYKTVNAVNNISFNIQKGERVAFIGPNGAGKSTTIKMLSSILHPTSGDAKIFGLTPWENRQALAHEIGTVFGQRSQLWYNLPVKDSFYLIGKIYNIDEVKLKRRVSKLVNLFEIRDLLNHPTKSLSLGQRMRCEIVASFIHNPKVLFLDEPTIGLDITAKAIIRELIKKQTLEEETTLLLTSHDTDDMEKVCDRVIIINKGKLILDNSINHLKEKYLNKKYIRATLDNGEKISKEVNTQKMPIQKVLEDLLKGNNIIDFTIENPPMEEIIKEIYNQDV